MNYVVARIVFAFRQFPIRLKRLGNHLANICPYRRAWWLDFSFLLLDFIFFFDVYELISNVIKSRPLRPTEQAILEPIFGETLPYELIRIDERARLGPPQYHFYYVSFLTINGWGEIGIPATNYQEFSGFKLSHFNLRLATLLVHETMHVWQYMQHGAAYIPRALSAQKTVMGYNYGGLQPLSEYPALIYFNYEQQADIIADAFALQHGGMGRWVKYCSSEEMAHYAPFLEEVRSATKAPPLGHSR